MGVRGRPIGSGIGRRSAGFGDGGSDRDAGRAGPLLLNPDPRTPIPRGEHLSLSEQTLRGGPASSKMRPRRLAPTTDASTPLLVARAASGTRLYLYPVHVGQRPCPDAVFENKEMGAITPAFRTGVIDTPLLDRYPHRPAATANLASAPSRSSRGSPITNRAWMEPGAFFGPSRPAAMRLPCRSSTSREANGRGERPGGDAPGAPRRDRAEPRRTASLPPGIDPYFS